MINGKTSFRPVFGSDEKINKIDPGANPGYVYFAEDSGKIYVDVEAGKRISCGGGGGGASVYYSQVDNLEPEVGTEDEYILDFTDLVDCTSMPLPGDLVINSNGVFLKIVNIDDTQLQCQKIAVSGNGTGPSSNSRILTIETIQGLPAVVINGKQPTIKFAAHSAVNEDGIPYDSSIRIAWQLLLIDGNNVSVQDSSAFDVANGEIREFTIQSLPDNATCKLTLQATAANSDDSKVYQFPIQTAFLSLMKSPNFSNASVFQNGSVEASCIIDGNMDKIIEFKLDGKVYFSQERRYDALHPERAQTTETYTFTNIPHGYHTLTMTLYQSSNNKKLDALEPLVYEVAVDNSKNEPIIWMEPMKDTYSEYDIIKIPYRVYVPGRPEFTVEWLKGITLAETRNLKEGTLDYFQIIRPPVGLISSYTVRVERPNPSANESKYFSRDISFYTEQDPREFVLAYDDGKTNNLLLNFDATGRTNSATEAVRNTWVGKSGEKAIFENFNWYNNGWLLDKDINSCLTISNGAVLKIPVLSKQVENVDTLDPNPEKGNWPFITLNSPSDADALSATFEFEFKLRNLSNFDNLIKSFTRFKNDKIFWDSFVEQFDEEGGYRNYDVYLRDVYDSMKPDTLADIALGDFTQEENFNGLSYIELKDSAWCTLYDENAKTGLKLGVQDCFFSTGPTKLSAKYVEGKKVHVSIVFNGDNSNPVNRRIYIYIEGVLTAVAKLGSSEGAFSIANPYIEFNSKYCDIDLYKFRIYKRALSAAQIINNLAVDNQDVLTFDITNTIITNNSVTGEYELSYKKMLEWNEAHPEDYLMPYLILDTTGQEDPQLPFTKTASTNISMTFVNTALDRAYITGELNEIVKTLPEAEASALAAQARAEDLTPVQCYYKYHCPSFTSLKSNISLGTQGTSSQHYPRRNYKAKTVAKVKKADGTEVKEAQMYMNRGPFEALFKTNPEACRLDYFYYNNYTYGTTKFTLKVDFMESSGTYNMGLANLVYKTYSKHPMDDYVNARAFSSKEVAGFELASDSFNANLDYYKDELGTIKVTDLTADSYKKNTYYIHKKASVAKTTDLRTNVQGFPVMTFWKNGSNLESYRFIGRYNMLTDKGSDETFGFKPLDESLYNHFISNKAIKKIAECWEFEDNARSFCSFRDPKNRYKLNFDVYEYEKQADGTIVKKRELNTKDSCPVVADSFEYRYHTNADFFDYIYDPAGEGKSKQSDAYKVFSWTAGDDTVENRSIKLLEMYGNWERACQWVWSTDPAHVTNRPLMDYTLATGEFNADTQYYDENEMPITNPDIDFFNAGLYYIGTPKTVTYSNVVYTNDTAEYRKAKFINELEDHFNKEYLMVYFIVTETLLLYDSRGKNCMMASWGPQKDGGDYIWYPIFYDMDTQLGLNNSGFPSFDYYENATPNQTFSTSDSILWNNLYNYFLSDIKAMYKKVRENTDIFRNVQYIEDWYEANPNVTHEIEMQGIRPLVMFNMDEQYKYLSICNEKIGYQTKSGTITTDDGSYFSRLQGDRSLSRQQFLSKRLNFMDSWLGIGRYDSENTDSYIKGRIGANNPTAFSDHWVYVPDELTEEEKEKYTNKGFTILKDYYKPDAFDSRGFPVKTEPLDGSVYFIADLIQRAYVTYAADNGAVTPVEYTGEPIKIDFQGAQKAGLLNSVDEIKENLFYIPGAENISSLGDISTLYWTEFETNNAPNLSRILLGSDAYGFKNHNLLKSPSFKAEKEGSLDPGKPMLKEVNLTGVIFEATGGLPSFNFTSSEKLEVFKGLGSNFASIDFADGVQLHTLYLPATATSLHLVEANNLTHILTHLNTSKEDLDNGNYYSKYNDQLMTWVSPQGLYIEGVTNITDITNKTSTQFNSLSLTGGQLKYDSYRLLNTLYQIYTIGANTKDNLAIALTKVKWSPYRLVEEGDYYDSSKTYVQDDQHYGFEEYKYEPKTWAQSVKNKEIYEFNAEIFEAEKDTITDIDMFKQFIAENRFRNADNNLNGTTPNISGEIYINNTTPIKESIIRNSLLRDKPSGSEKAGFSQHTLNIHFANVTKENKARFISMDDDGISYTLIGEEVVTGTETAFTSPYKQYNVQKANYTFKGWSTSQSANDIIPEIAWETSNKAKPVEGTNTYIYYAIFDRVKYNVNFYWGVDSDHLIYNKPVPVVFGDTIGALDFMPQLDESVLPYNMRYTFLGWTNQRRESYVIDSMEDAPSTFINVANVQVASEGLVFYAVFIKESVYASVTGVPSTADNDTRDRLLEQQYIFTPYGSGRGYSISLRQGVTLAGKITLPSTYKGLPILKVDEQGFYAGTLSTGVTNITHVFWEPGCKLESYGHFCFRQCTSLKYIELPSSLQILDGNCFEDTSLDFSLFDLSQCTNLTTIRAGTFYKAFNTTGGTLIIPGSVTTLIGNRIFGPNYFEPFILDKIVFGSLTMPTQLTNILDVPISPNIFDLSERPDNFLVEIYGTPSTTLKIFALTLIGVANPEAENFDNYTGLGGKILVHDINEGVINNA